MSDWLKTARVHLRRGGDWKVKPEAEQYDGKVLKFTRGWDITPEDSSIYIGEVAWIPEDRKIELGWMASGDLEFLD